MNLAPVIKQRFFDVNGLPLAGGKVYAYEAGTTTPQATYTDSSGITPNLNPVILDAEGEADIWLDPSLSYKFILKDSSDVLQWTVDNVIGALTANSVGTATIQDGAVTGPKIADGAVGLSKLSSQIFGPDALLNYSLTATVASNNLNIALRDAAGAAPSSSSPVNVAFRSSPATSGLSVIRSVITAITGQVSMGSTLGSVDAKKSPVYLYLLDNAGSVELAWSAVKTWDEGSLQSTSADGGTATDKNTLYSNIARSGVAIRLVGRLMSTQATAGTWATAPSELSLIPLEQEIQRSEVWVYTGNTYGATSYIRRWTTIGKNIGSAITYADDALNGGSFTINEDGLYAIAYFDLLAGSTNFGVSLNATLSEIGMPLPSIPLSKIIAVNTTSGGTSSGSVGIVTALVAGDVVRAHSEGTTQGVNTLPQMFRITKISS